MNNQHLGVARVRDTDMVGDTHISGCRVQRRRHLLGVFVAHACCMRTMTYDELWSSRLHRQTRLADGCSGEVHICTHPD
jgi:hypothetical protein